jgi:hypothetical protein
MHTNAGNEPSDDNDTTLEASVERRKMDHREAEKRRREHLVHALLDMAELVLEPFEFNTDKRIFPIHYQKGREKIELSKAAVVEMAIEVLQRQEVELGGLMDQERNCC